jgi:hypothetical protein
LTDNPSPPQALALLFKMVAPTRGTKVLLGVSTLLDVAGILIVVIAANFTHTGPIPLSLSIVAAALIGLGAFIFGCLVIAALRRQSKRLPPG